MSQTCDAGGQHEPVIYQITIGPLGVITATYKCMKCNKIIEPTKWKLAE